MNHFMFALNATVPVFMVILIGYFLKKVHILNDNFIAPCNSFNFKITLPLLLFEQISTTDIIHSFKLEFILYCAIVTSICFWGLWFLTRIFVKEKEARGAFVQASFRGSAAVLGIAFIMNLYGDAGMAPMMIVGAVPLYNIYSVIVLSFESNDVSTYSFKTTFMNILKNPIIIGIVAGIIVSLLQIDFPEIIDKTIHNFAVIASPLALVTIGAAFQGKEAIAKIKLTTIASLIKLVILPAIFLPIAYYLGFRNSEMIAILIMLGSPTTASCYIMAQQMKNDEVLTSSIVVMTTLLSSISLTFWIFLLHSIQAI